MPNVAFTRWDPLRDLLALHEQLGQLVGTDAPGWTPPVDLYETASDFILTAELPGLARDQIEIHAEESRIVIRGARASAPAATFRASSSIASSAATAAFHARSRCRNRSTSSAVSADLKDGVLTVTIPKADRSRRPPHRRQLTPLET